MSLKSRVSGRVIAVVRDATEGRTVQAQIQEIALIRQSLYELESQHAKTRNEYVPNTLTRSTPTKPFPDSRGSAFACDENSTLHATSDRHQTVPLCRTQQHLESLAAASAACRVRCLRLQVRQRRVSEKCENVKRKLKGRGKGSGNANENENAREKWTDGRGNTVDTQRWK